MAGPEAFDPDFGLGGDELSQEEKVAYRAGYAAGLKAGLAAKDQKTAARSYKRIWP